MQELRRHSTVGVDADTTPRLSVKDAHTSDVVEAESRAHIAGLRTAAESVGVDASHLQNMLASRPPLHWAPSPDVAAAVGALT
jgi:hypothetical protein